MKYRFGKMWPESFGDMVIVALALPTILVVWWLLSLLFQGSNGAVDARSEQLCREWAAVDHSGAVPEQRLKWLKENGVWDSFDWYGSCMAEGEWLRNMGRSK